MKLSEHRQQVVDSIIKAIEANNAPWQKPWQMGEAQFPVNGTKDYRYKGINAISLMQKQIEKGYTRNDWYTFEQAKSLGASIKKGEKSSKVEFWKLNEQVDIKDEEGNPKLDENGRPIKEWVKLSNARVFYSLVFNADQLVNPPQRDIKAINPELIEQENRVLIDTLAANMGVTFTHSPQDKAYYSPSQDVIRMPLPEQFISQGHYLATSLHELGHATGHTTRLDRDMSGDFGSVSYAKEELRAEIASWMMAMETGLPHDPSNHAAYTQSWLQVLKNEPNAIFEAIKDANEIQYYFNKMLNPEIELPSVDFSLIMPAKDYSDIEHWPSAKQMTNAYTAEDARDAVNYSLIWEASRKENWLDGQLLVIAPVLADVNKEGRLSGPVVYETDLALYVGIAKDTAVQVDKTSVILPSKGIGVAHQGDFITLTYATNGKSRLDELEKNSDRSVTIDEDRANMDFASKIHLDSINQTKDINALPLGKLTASIPIITEHHALLMSDENASIIQTNRLKRPIARTNKQVDFDIKPFSITYNDRKSTPSHDF